MSWFLGPPTDKGETGTMNGMNPVKRSGIFMGEFLPDSEEHVPPQGLEVGVPLEC